MIALREESEIATLREANRIVSDTLVTLVEQVRPGITTRELDAIAEDCIRGAGAAPSFLGYRGTRTARIGGRCHCARDTRRPRTA